MVLYICAIIIGIFSILGIGSDIGSKGQKVLRSLRFWCEVIVILATLVMFIVAARAQARASRDEQRERAEKTLAEERQATAIANVGSNQKTQLATQERQLKTQEAQLAGAKDLVKAQEEQKANLSLAIEAQRGEIDLLNRLTLNQNLSGMELSFTPPPEQWNRIAAAYRLIESPEQDVSYSDAAMMAERVGDHWKIDFEPVAVKERIIETPKGPMRIGGNKKFRKLSTSDLKNKAFEEVIKEASLGLRIEWGNGTQTALEPRDDDYPSAIYVSHNKIGLILRPPLVLWNLNELKHNAKATFYGRDYPVPLPASFIIRSLDPAVILNQAVELNWRKRESTQAPPYEMQMNPKISGPHSLSVDFSFFGPLAGKPYIPR
jgi:hypothetical protein